MSDNDTALRKYYLKIVMYSVLAGFPFCVGVFALSSKLILFVFGYKWLPVAEPLRILCVLGMLKSLTANIGALLYSKGRPDLVFKWSVLYLFTNVVATLIGISYGIVGVAIAVTINGFLCFPLLIYITNVIIKLRWKEYVGNIYPIFVASLGMGAFLLISNILINHSIIYFLLTIIAGLAIYFILLKSMGISVLEEIKKVYTLAISKA